MTLVITVTDNFTNPDLPYSDSVSPLFKSNALGVYEMTDIYDQGTSGKNLATSLKFNGEGLVCTGGTDNYADTGIVLPDKFSGVIAFKPSGTPGETSNIFNNLVMQGTDTNPDNSVNFVKGMRLAQTTNDKYQLANGVLGGLSKGAAGTLSNSAWTIMAFYCDLASGFGLTLGDGSTNSYDLEDGVTLLASDKSMLVSGGYPGRFNVGFNGTIGCFALYDGVFDSDGAATAIAAAKKVMQKKGVTIS